MEIDERVLAAKFEALLPHLDERQRRLVQHLASSLPLTWVGDVHCW
jgi:hypothetical protein